MFRLTFHPKDSDVFSFVFEVPILLRASCWSWLVFDSMLYCHLPLLLVTLRRLSYCLIKTKMNIKPHCDIVQNILKLPPTLDHENYALIKTAFKRKVLYPFFSLRPSIDKRSERTHF